MEENTINIEEQLAILEETKSQIKQSIISKEQEVSENDSFRSYASKISNIVTLKEGSADANASAGDILNTKTAYVDGQKIEGTLVPLDTSDATATANDILSPETAYVNGEKVTGRIIPTYAPSSIVLSRTIDTEGLKILEFSKKLNVILYLKSSNSTTLFVSSVENGEIDTTNEVSVPISTLGINKVSFVSLNENSNVMGTYNLLVSSSGTENFNPNCTLSFNTLSLNDFSIIHSGNLSYKCNGKIYAHPTINNLFNCTNVYRPSQNNINIVNSIIDFSTLSVKSEVVKTITINAATDFRVGGVNSAWDETGRYIITNASFKKHDGWILTDSILVHFDDTFTSGTVIRDDYNSNKCACFLTGNKCLFGDNIYTYEGDTMTNIQSLSNPFSILNGKDGDFSYTNWSYDSSNQTDIRYFEGKVLYCKLGILSIYNFIDNINSLVIDDTVNSLANNTRIELQTQNASVISSTGIIYDVYLGTSNILTKLNRLNTDFVDTSSATALAGDIAQGKTAYVGGNKVTGTMPNNGAITITPTTSQQTIPAGYTSGGTVSAVTSSIDNNIQAENIKLGISILRNNRNI